MKFNCVFAHLIKAIGVVLHRISPGQFLGHWSYFNSGETQFLSVSGSTSEVLILNQSRDAGNRGASASVVAGDEGTVVFEFSRQLMDKCVLFSYHSITKNLIAIGDIRVVSLPY